jgi:hypothetical protein
MSDKPSIVALADDLSDLLSGIAGWLLVGVGTLGTLTAVGGLVQAAGMGDVVVPSLALVVSLAFVAAGVSVNPRFRRRLARRRDASRFGRVRTVDERTLSASENRTETCVGCGTDVTEGLVRRYREEYAVAGVPVRTTSEEYNFYCPRCGAAETSVSAPSTTDEESLGADAADADAIDEEAVTDVE